MWHNVDKTAALCSCWVKQSLQQRSMYVLFLSDRIQQGEGKENKKHVVRREEEEEEGSEEYNCLQYLISKKTCSSKWFSPLAVCGTLRIQPRTHSSPLCSVNQTWVTQTDSHRNTTENSWTWFSYEMCQNKTHHGLCTFEKSFTEHKQEGYTNALVWREKLKDHRTVLVIKRINFLCGDDFLWVTELAPESKAATVCSTGAFSCFSIYFCPTI